jgi:hypothetical protein
MDYKNSTGADMKTRMTTIATALVLVGGIFTTQAYAGPVIIDGSDAEEHGSVSGGVNQNGWAYFQRGFENLLPQVGNGNTIAVCLGCTGNTQTAFASAFDIATKPAGWTRATADGAAAITNFFAGVGPNTLANTGLVYIPTGSGTTSGGITGDELAVINTNAVPLNNFVGGAGNPAAGGGLFAHGEGGTPGAWGWLTTLIPGIVPVDSGGGSNLQLTAAGAAAFPALTNADIQGATPWHNHFEGSFGGLSILVETTNGPAGRAVVLGGAAATQIGCGLPGQPPCSTGVPEPATLPLLGLGALGLAALLRRRRSA